MKNLKLFLDHEEVDELQVGLVRLIKDLPEHELFFSLNNANNIIFKRIDDLNKKGKYFDYSHSRYQGYHSETKNCFQFISNKSIQCFQKKEQYELFLDEENINYLLPFSPEVDYIVKTEEISADFSLILLPENTMFQIQDFRISSQDELYHLIQYYE